MYDVITIGSATRDLFIQSPAFEIHEKDHSEVSIEACFPLGSKIELDDIVLTTGGGATNAAVTFARLGHKAACICAVGDDDPGKEAAAALKEERVDVSLAQVVARKKTAFSVIALAGSGERTVLVYRGASEALDVGKLRWPRLKTRWFYISSLGGNVAVVKKVLAHAAKTGARVAWNPGAKELKLGLHALSPLIRKVDVFNLNKEEAAHLVNTDPENFRHILKSLRDLPKRALVVTDGLKGAFAADRASTLHCGVIDVPRVNVTGAGDAFGSGLVAGLLKKDDLRYALAVGTWNATGVVQKMGAKTGIIDAYPRAAQLKKVAIAPWK